MVDSYSQVMADTIRTLEDIYGVDSIVANAGSGISTVVSQMIQKIAKIPAEQKGTINSEAGKHVVIIAYICLRMGYYSVSRMDFGPFYEMQEVVEIIQLFCTKDGFTKENTNKLNRIVKILEIAETESANVRHGLAYRYLRMFVIMVIYGVSCNACIIANLICQQAVAQSNVLEKK